MSAEPVEYSPSDPYDPRTLLGEPGIALDGVHLYTDCIFEVANPTGIDWNVGIVQYMVCASRRTTYGMPLIAGMIVFKRPQPAARIFAMFPFAADVMLFELSGTRVEHARSLEDTSLSWNGQCPAIEYFGSGALDRSFRPETK